MTADRYSLTKLAKKTAQTTKLGHSNNNNLGTDLPDQNLTIRQFFHDLAFHIWGPLD